MDERKVTGLDTVPVKIDVPSETSTYINSPVKTGVRTFVQISSYSTFPVQLLPVSRHTRRRPKVT